MTFTLLGILSPPPLPPRADAEHRAGGSSCIRSRQQIWGAVRLFGWGRAEQPEFCSLPSNSPKEKGKRDPGGFGKRCHGLGDGSEEPWPKSCSLAKRFPSQGDGIGGSECICREQNGSKRL